MTTSNSTVFDVTRDQLIEGALRMIGALSQGQTPNAVQVSDAAISLNMMIKAWEADGMPLWGLAEYSVPITAGVSIYQIGIGKTINTPKPLKVIQAWNRDSISFVDIPMRILTKQEYNMLGNKTSSGNPIQLYYQPLLNYGELHLFPTPDATSSTGNTIYITYQRPFEDMLIAGDTLDFPQEWLEAIKYGLAVRLAPEYGLDIESRRLLMQEAALIKNTALSFGTEEGSIFFQADKRNY